MEEQLWGIKSENGKQLTILKKLERSAAKARASDVDKQAAADARVTLGYVFEKLTVIEQLLAPYERIKSELSRARIVYRDLVNRFVEELKARCNALGGEQKRILVLDLLAEDVQSSLGSALSEKRQLLTSYIEKLWDKYHVSLTALRNETRETEAKLDGLFTTTRNPSRRSRASLNFLRLVEPGGNPREPPLTRSLRGHSKVRP